MSDLQFFLVEPELVLVLLLLFLQRRLRLLERRHVQLVSRRVLLVQTLKETKIHE